MRLDGVSDNQYFSYWQNLKKSKELKVLYNDFEPTNRQSFDYSKTANGKFKFNYKMTVGPIQNQPTRINPLNLESVLTLLFLTDPYPDLEFILTVIFNMR